MCKLYSYIIVEDNVRVDENIRMFSDPSLIAERSDVYGCLLVESKS